MFEPNAHVGEDAELYALGQLDDVARARLERHVRVCAECARRVGEAESTVLRLIEAQAPAASAALRPFRANGSRPAWAWIAAVAAAFILGFLPWMLAPRTAAPPAEQVAMNAMLHSHFQHAQFVADVADAPSAKVIYGRDGGWLYVLAAPGNASLSIAIVSHGTQTTVAALPAATQTRAAYVALPAPVDEVILLDGARRVAHANVVLVTNERR